MKPPGILSNCRLLARQVAKTKRIPVPAKVLHTSQASEKDQTTGFSHYAASIGVASLVTAISAYKTIQALNRDAEEDSGKFGKIFSRKEVSKHDSPETGIWITYRGKVYDITDFVQHHPGGSHTIMMGAGGDVEPFWQTYTVHEAAEVQMLLSKYQIGVLSDEDMQEENQITQQLEGPYSNDPKRSTLLQVLSQQPFNAETPSKLLISTATTPTDIFFVRNHLPVPEVDLADYKLVICIGTDKDQDEQKVLAEFTLDELKTKFKPHTIDCVIQCSGNRRSDLKKLKEIKGLDWKTGAMGNARWTGVKLVDLIDSLNIRADKNLKHVQMEGLDCDMSGQSYGASISADVAFNPQQDVLLAYEMNGKPLTRDHGFPLRFIAPGITGARNVKWLGKIILSHEESNSHWQRNDYKSFSPNVGMFNLDYSQAISIQEMPVQSAICDPSDGDKVKLRFKDGSKPIIPIKGYAYSGGGKMIVRVDVSIDGGSTWLTANLDDLPRQTDGNPDFTARNRCWSWTRWSLDLPISGDLVRSSSGSVEILCRAFDSAYNSQPERAETVWNVRGVVNNSWHRIRLNIVSD